MNKLKTIMMVLFLPVLLEAQGVNYTGTSAANFLKIGLGAKAVGMAEADITLTEDASSLYWNPGTISRNDQASAVFSYIRWIAETNVSYFSFTLPTGIGTAGLDVTYFGSGNIEETTLQRQDGTGRVVSASDLSVGLAFARNLTDRFSVGLKVKYLREQLASVHADAFAFDVGSVFITSFLNDLRIGIALSNFGGAFRFEGNELLVTHVVPGSPTSKQIPAVLETQEWDLPLFFKIGVATNIINAENFRWQTAYTITDSRDYEPRHNLGASLTLMNIVSLRGGYRFNYDETTYSAGIGIGVPASGFGNISFDYAYTDFGKLKAIHQFTIGINF